MELNLFIAFAAGLVSFFAPCVTVLVPAFLAHLSGVSLSDPNQVAQSRWQIFYNTLAFILGFTVIFVLLGAALGVLSSLILDYQIWLSRIGGILIIYFGLISLKLLPSPFGAGATLKTTTTSSIKLVGSFLVGSTFAIGWSSCVGPILAAILVLAGTAASLTSGVTLLLAYSIGLMVPFLLVGLFTVRAANFLSTHPKLIDNISKVGGVLLVILGVLVFTDQFRRLVGALYFLSPIRI